MPGLNLTAIWEMSPVDRLYLGLGLLTSLASLAACVTLFLAVCCIPTIRNKARYIVLFIVIANAGASLGTVMSVAVKVGYPVVSWRSHPVCESAAALSVLFRISGYLWTVTLAIYLCLEAWKKTFNFTSSVILWPAHCICWGFPVAIMLTLVALDVLGSDTGKHPEHVRPPWCFVDRQISDYNTFVILAGMGWRMAAIILCSVAYLLLQFQALKKPKTRQPERRQEGEEHQKPQDGNPNRKLRHLLVLFVLLNIWGAWHFLISYYRPDVDVMVAIEVICDNLQGFINTCFFIFFFPEVRRSMRDSCCRPLCKCCCKRLRDAKVSLPVEMEQLREEGGDHDKLLGGEEMVHFTQEPGHPDS